MKSENAPCKEAQIRAAIKKYEATYAEIVQECRRTGSDMAEWRVWLNDLRAQLVKKLRRIEEEE